MRSHILNQINQQVKLTSRQKINKHDQRNILIDSCYH